MKPTILGLRTTIYKVNDLAKAKDWYSKAFKTVPYFDEPFYVGFNIGGYELGLDPNELPETRSNAVVSYWGTDDIQSELQHFLSTGATLHDDLQNVGGEIMIATVQDPWGNIIGLIYNPEFKLQH